MAHGQNGKVHVKFWAYVYKKCTVVISAANIIIHLWHKIVKPHDKFINADKL